MSNTRTVPFPIADLDDFTLPLVCPECGEYARDISAIVTYDLHRPFVMKLSGVWVHGEKTTHRRVFDANDFRRKSQPEPRFHSNLMGPVDSIQRVWVDGKPFVPETPHG